MDETDLKILSHLQENARLSMVEIGKLVGLSSLLLQSELED